MTVEASFFRNSRPVEAHLDVAGRRHQLALASHDLWSHGLAGSVNGLVAHVIGRFIWRSVHVAVGHSFDGAAFEDLSLRGDGLSSDFLLLTR